MDSALVVYVARFLEWSAAVNLSEQTVLSRKRALNRFVIWCAERELDRPQDITKPILERYRRYLFHYRKANGEPLSFATQQQRLIPIKAFFKWLAQENHILYNPASELALPKVHKRLPKAILSADEVERILNQTLLHGEKGIRDRAILETLYSSGIRRMELVNLTLYDADLKNGTLMVREGKGKKDRMVPLGQRACTWIERYRDEVRPGLITELDDGTLFLHETGEPLKKNRLTDLVKKHIAAAGISKPGACHLFRHTMATLMLDNGADIRHIQAILGHSQLSTTEIYTQVSIRKLKEIHALTHPADRPQARQTQEGDDGNDEYTLFTALAAEADDDPETVELSEWPQAVGDSGAVGSLVTALASVSNPRAANPWRKSRGLQTAASAAPNWNGRSLAGFVQGQWLRSKRSASCLALVSFS